MAEAALLEIQNLNKAFRVRGNALLGPRKHVHAINDVNLTVKRGEILAVVGESGSGKTTLGRMLIRLLDPTSGRIVFDGTDLTSLSGREMRRMRRRMQIIFQDPYSSLNPYMTVGDALAEVLDLHGDASSRTERDRQVGELLGTVGLRRSAAVKYPHEFSGGQRQRIGIARAIAAKPEFIVADEPVSALDVSVQAQILNLLSDLRASMGLTMVFITHDLSVVRQIADRVAVMYLGRLMEVSDVDEFFDRPMHPYTEALLSAVPTPDLERERKRVVLTGEIPSPLAPPSGCVFRTRCPHAVDACASTVPPLEPRSPTRATACIQGAVVT